ncbi:MAG: pyruvate formate lyase-activating protein [Ruminococcaceae bacterium]|nr:pyruvate formate lyase-activating protein [Oscillospiraceae bacterium]
MQGRINSIQTLGALDGPGVRFVVFTQGCNLRCGCCHNPDTWDTEGGKIVSAKELADKALRYREYFGEEGGVTVSGGEPLLQPEFVKEFFRFCKISGLHTCLDTSGSILNDSVKDLLEYTDLVLLDIKYTTDELYHKYVGCSIEKPFKFLNYLNQKKIPVILRQVIIPGLNDDKESIARTSKIIENHPCIVKSELLGFKNICKVKYDKMGLEFPFEDYQQPSKKLVEELQKKLPR